MSWYGNWKPYVPVAKRRSNALAYAKTLAKKEKRVLAPVKLAGRKIATTFWGLEWCKNLQRYSDYANRLPRGETYVRNGSVIDLQIEKGLIKSIVSGSEIYTIKITIVTLPKAKWTRIKAECSQSIDSLIDLLQGRFDQAIMQRLTQRDDGLFPQPKEIRMSCSCPDSAGMCKHIAATMYGVGARLDTAPELLFTLRAVDHLELIRQAVTSDNLDRTLIGIPDDALASSELGELFGIEIDSADSTPKARSRGTSAAAAPVSAAPRKKTTRKSLAKPSPLSGARATAVATAKSKGKPATLTAARKRNAR